MKNNKLMDNPILRYFKSNWGAITGLLLLCLLLSVMTDTFLKMDNLITVLRQISINAILAFGMTMVLIIGGIDLTVGSVVAVSGTFVVLLIQNFQVAIVPAILCTILLGGIIGCVNGGLASRTTIPPFIITLAMQTLVKGVAYMIADGKSIPCKNKAFNSIGNGYIGAIPIPVIVMFVLVIITGIILTQTKFGRRMYAIGGNRDAAIYSGINVKNIELIVYIIAAVLSSIAGILLASRMYSGQPTAGDGYESDAIAAAVLGGTSFSGGIGTIGGTIIGALIIGVLNNGLNLMQVTFYWQFIIKGMVIIGAVYIDTIKSRKSAR